MQPTATPAEAGTPAAPKQHIPPAQRLYTIFIGVPLMAMATAFFGTTSLICGLWDRTGKQQHLVARAWAATLLGVALSPVEVVNAERLRGAPVAVFASNHLSYMDTPVVFAKMPFQFRILAKQGLWKLPFVGWYLKRSGQVPIDASSSRSAVAGLLRGVKALNSGMRLFVFPEGSRSPDGRLQTSASGAAFMAIRAGVPLVPLALVGTYELLPIHVYCLRPRPVKMIAGEPISTEGLTTRDADALTERLHAAIAEMYYAHHPELEPPATV
jgi:1-acyl-sn-glycerol-3-phosphate acyltransferase